MSLKKPIWIRAIVWMACWLLPFALLAQDRTVNGRLFSKVDQTPVSGASVLIKGTNTGTSTASDGKFSIQAKKGDVLVLSGVGFVLSEITLGDATDLKLEVEKDVKSMNEVVVTALGVRKETKRIGYAIQEVKGEDLVKARDQNPISGLTGKVAGLSVGPSAELLRKPTVLLRGNEITLYVVDGIPISSDTWNISPDDVDTYTVLKGPTAAALYGSRAQYGAILITTKKGNKARAKGLTVEFNSSNVVDKGFIAFPRVPYEYGPGEN